MKFSSPCVNYLFLLSSTVIPSINRLVHQATATENTPQLRKRPASADVLRQLNHDPFPLTDVGLNPTVALGICEGDCDSDANCGGDLKCHQRSDLSAIPSCTGTGTNLWDYCIYPPLTDIGVNPAFALGRCQGDCDSDFQCDGDLTCHERNGYEPIPGCSGSGTSGWDYCSYPPLTDIAITPTDPVGVCEGDCDDDSDCRGDLTCHHRNGIEPIPGCSGKGTSGWDYCSYPPVVSVHISPTAILELCEGDCDTDADCEGYLKCHQRDNFEDIPGCSGWGKKGWDYCTYPSLVDFGASPNIALGLCEGDCDSDADCKGDLTCYERNDFEPIPGCSGSGKKGWDYCSYPLLTDVAITPTDALGLCEGDCDDDADCGGDFKCHKRNGFTPIPGCTGSGSKDWDYCSYPSLTDIAITPTDVLELCEGDCDSDSDCDGYLVCFQRNKYEDIPGCSGSGTSGWDYCTYPPLTDIGANPTGALGICEGDCDSDANCAAGLSCHHRGGFEPIPGCTESGTKGWDYCSYPLLTDVAITPTDALGLCEGDCDTDADCEGEFTCHKRNGFAPIPGCTGSGSKDWDYCGYPPLTDKGLEPPVPLELCEGDCDSDADCDGYLKCFQRNSFQDVPGCSGSGTKAWDYCIYPSLTSVAITPTDALGICEGDCDSDADCAGDLVCHERDNFEQIPGCTGSGNKGWDYCSYPLLTDIAITPTDTLWLCEGDCDTDADCGGDLKCSKRSGLTPIPGCLGSGSKNWDYCTYPSVVDVALDPLAPFLPLGLCRGDCDSDSECVGYLVCHQRNSFEDVPGCSGSGTRGWDYCSYPPLTDIAINPAVTLGRCEGDCDSDANCAVGLTCHHRNNFEDIPRCSGSGTKGWDYCA